MSIRKNFSYNRQLSVPESSIGLNIKKSLLVLLVLTVTGFFAGISPSAFTRAAVASGNTGKLAEPVETAHGLVLTENFENALSVYANLLLKDSLNGSLNAEFAYVLALEGIYDAALIRIDKIWTINQGTAETVYYTSQVLSLMGYDVLAAEIVKNRNGYSEPKWISPKAGAFLEKYKRTAPDTTGLSPSGIVKTFNQANKNAAQGQTIQSLVLFDKITGRYPDEYFFYVGYSLALEKAGMQEKAVQVTERAISLLGDDPEQERVKQILDQRLIMLKGKSDSDHSNQKTPSSTNTTNEQGGLNLMAYGGGFISKGFTNINVRAGIFFTKNSYATLDVGLSGTSSAVYTNLGLTVYNRQKIFVGGFGLTGSFGEGNSVFYSKISVGPSIMNKKGTASLDIFLDGKMPLKKGYPTVMGISVGESIYFGKRK